MSYGTVHCGTHLADLRSLVVASILCAFLLGGCRKRQVSSAQTLTNPGFVEIYALSKTPTEGYNAAFIDGGGARWYRAPVPAFDLSSFKWQSPLLGEDDRKNASVLLVVADSDQQERLRSWADDHVGAYAGTFINGQLLAISKLENAHNPTCGLFALPGLTDEGACRVELIIRWGGVDPATGKPPERQVVSTSPAPMFLE